MDTTALIREAKARFQHQESKQYLKEKYTASLNFVSQGGFWTASVELIAFLRTSETTEVILIDNYQKPIMVNVAELLVAAEETYSTVTEQWYTEFTELKSNR